MSYIMPFLHSHRFMTTCRHLKYIFFCVCHLLPKNMSLHLISCADIEDGKLYVSQQAPFCITLILYYDSCIITRFHIYFASYTNHYVTEIHQVQWDQLDFCNKVRCSLTVRQKWLGWYEWASTLLAFFDTESSMPFFFFFVLKEVQK